MNPPQGVRKIVSIQHLYVDSCAGCFFPACLHCNGLKSGNAQANLWFLRSNIDIESIPGTYNERGRFTDRTRCTLAATIIRRIKLTSQSTGNLKAALMATLALSAALGLAACEKKGPAAQAGEEVDEAIDTMKHGGKESTSSKVDDAVDEAREGASDAAEQLKKD